MKDATVTILRSTPGGRDEYDDPIASTTTRTDVTECDVAPVSSTEPTAAGRNGVVIGWDVYAPAAVGVHHTDRVEIYGDGTVISTGLPVTPASAIVCAVEGEIADWGGSGVVISVRRAQG